MPCYARCRRSDRMQQCQCLFGVRERLGGCPSPYTRSNVVRGARILSSRDAPHAGARQARTATANNVAIEPRGQEAWFRKALTGRCELPRISTASHA